MNAQPVAAADSGGAAGWLRVALAGATSPKARRVARALTMGIAAWEVGRKAYTLGRDRITYTVTVAATDEVYDAVHDWMIEQVPAERRRSLSVSTRSVSSEVSPVSDTMTPEPPPRMRLHYDGSREQGVVVDGHRVLVKVERSPMAEGFSLSVNSGGDWARTLQRIVFTCHGVTARDAVLALLADLASRRATMTRTPKLWTAARWGGWTRCNDAPQRALRTVVLADGMLDGIVGDLTTFLASEGRYAEVGLPWHRGYLFHGPPGTGKTSAAKALASHFGLDVYFLPLSDLEADANLLAMLADVSTRSMLVLEDIDVVHAAKSREDDAKRVSLSGLLNALDGFTTPHGLITVMTTNNLGVLDPALRRAGRADMLAEFGLLDDDQAARLMAMVSGLTTTPMSLCGGVLAHADLLEAAKPHLHEPARAWEAMVARIAKARNHADAVLASEPGMTVER